MNTSTGSGLSSFLGGIFCQNFWSDRLYDKKETKKYKCGIVNLFWNEEDLTDSFRARKATGTFQKQAPALFTTGQEPRFSKVLIINETGMLFLHSI